MNPSQPPDPFSDLLNQYVQSQDNLRQRGKLQNQILGQLQQSLTLWQGEGVDADCYAQAYQFVIVRLWDKLDKFCQQQAQQPRSFVDWVNAHLAIEAIDCSNNIWRGGDPNSQVYQEALQMARQQLFEDFDHYNPQLSSLTTWFNRILKYRIQDLYQQAQRQVPANTFIDSDIEDAGAASQPIQTSTQLLPMDAIPDGEDYVSTKASNGASAPSLLVNLQSQELIQDFRHWVETAQARLQCHCLQNRLDVNCFALILYRLPQEVNEFPGHFTDGLSWAEIAEQLGVPARNIRRHFNQRCLPLVKQGFPIQDYL